MHQFFVTPEAINGDMIAITGAEAHHLLKVLRLGIGDRVTVADGEGQRFAAVLETIAPDDAYARIETTLPTGEPPVEIILLQGIPKSDKMELIIQKNTELGIGKIIPVEMERSVVRLKENKAAKRAQRWQRIALEAAKQCGRSRVPQIAAPCTLTEALMQLPHGCSLTVPWEEETGHSLGHWLAELKSTARVAYIIGPEGGLTTGEVDLARRHGAVPVTLGQRILRTETAAMAVLAVIMHRLGDLGGQAGGKEGSSLCVRVQS
ncbi:16S rRNA (uracil(1498)-N(3))-methyltransferase [Metallumcola ferriviriculae]|uniref:Ribosomal RNA small subunit methyltransferase E n=1 Tax=Metallumcola ferriviriculae TaxID=3039180 RepID=A0AAU0UM73_9FIRM|nr:16S rRNA (uracil(1498)-N(3))-methyltransferase [Desulfitibacteraceae bacterium MK1]